jgi:hypothetical protein
VQAIFVRFCLIIWMRAGLNDDWSLLTPANWHDWTSAETKPCLEPHPSNSGGLRVTVQQQAPLLLGHRLATSNVA